MQGELSETETTFYADFAIAGQDVFAVVAFLAYFMGKIQVKAVNLQISAFPVPTSIIYIADAAATKVCSFDVYQI